MKHIKSSNHFDVSFLGIMPAVLLLNTTVAKAATLT